MVLLLKKWESRSPPSLPSAQDTGITTQNAGIRTSILTPDARNPIYLPRSHTFPHAGWSSPVARQAHNLKVVSSNLAPATKFINSLDLVSSLLNPSGDPYTSLTHLHTRNHAWCIIVRAGRYAPQARRFGCIFAFVLSCFEPLILGASPNSFGDVPSAGRFQ